MTWHAGYETINFTLQEVRALYCFLLQLEREIHDGKRTAFDGIIVDKFAVKDMAFRMLDVLPREKCRELVLGIWPRKKVNELTLYGLSTDEGGEFK